MVRGRTRSGDAGDAGDADRARRAALALALGTAGAAGGVVIGAVLGAVSMAACGVAAVVLLLLGLGSDKRRPVAGAAVGAGLLACIACGVAGVECPRWWRLTHVPVREVSSLREAGPGDREQAALHVPGIEQDVALRATARWTARVGNSNTPQTQTATPLVEGAAREVVGFVCFEGSGVAPPAGAWLLPLPLWGGDTTATCERAIALALERLAATHRVVDARAEQRVFKAFPTEAALRTAADPWRVVRVVLGLWGVYALVFVLGVVLGVVRGRARRRH
jgi:hypothetical protein